MSVGFPFSKYLHILVVVVVYKCKEVFDLKIRGLSSPSYLYLYLNLLFPDSPPGAVVGVAEDLLARSQGRRVVTAGGGADINSFGHLQGNLLQFFVPKLFVSLKSGLEMLETWTLSEIRILLSVYPPP